MTASAPLEFWQQPITALTAELGGSVTGLEETEARRRQGRIGPNQVRPRVERALLVQFVRYFRNPLVLILLAASAIAGMLGDIRSFLVISAIVAVSVTLDFLQEHRAGRAVDRLRRSVALRAMVVRDGLSRELPVAELVPGDIVLLAAGDLVPADGRVLEARDLFLNQGLLTGESYPVEKLAADAAPGADLVDATNALFMGTSVISGAGRMLLSTPVPPPRSGTSPAAWRNGRRQRPSSAAPRPSVRSSCV